MAVILDQAGLLAGLRIVIILIQPAGIIMIKQGLALEAVQAAQALPVIHILICLRELLAEQVWSVMELEVVKNQQVSPAVQELNAYQEIV